MVLALLAGPVFGPWIALFTIATTPLLLAVPVLGPILAPVALLVGF
jgi:hypothetical protein